MCLVLLQPCHQAQQVTAWSVLANSDEAIEVPMVFKDFLEGLTDCTQFPVPRLPMFQVG